MKMAKRDRQQKDKNNVLDITSILETNNADNVSRQQLITNLRKSKFEIEFRTETQKKLWDIIEDHEITLCSGPAGTGKSYISIAKSIDLVLIRKRSDYRKIIIVKPMVEAEEKMGFLPGDIMDKMNPYIYSTLYLFSKILGENKTQLLIKHNYIEPIALAFTRGINIDNAVVIVEEAQNMSPRAMKTLLTRIGENCKMIISGDLEQSDLYKKSNDTGLYMAMEKLVNLEEIGIVRFDESEIVRNPLIGKILNKLNGNFN